MSETAIKDPVSPTITIEDEMKQFYLDYAMAVASASEVTVDILPRLKSGDSYGAQGRH